MLLTKLTSFCSVQVHASLSPVPVNDPHCACSVTLVLGLCSQTGWECVRLDSNLIGSLCRSWTPSWSHYPYLPKLDYRIVPSHPALLWVPRTKYSDVYEKRYDETQDFECWCEILVRKLKVWIRTRLSGFESLKKNFTLYFMRINALSTCRSMYHMHAWCLQRPEEGIGSPGTGVTNSSEPQNEY